MEDRQVNLKDIRAEPISLPFFILQIAMKIGEDIHEICIKERMNKYSLIALKQDIWFLHAHTVLRGDFSYYQKYLKKKDEIEKCLSDEEYWKDEGKDNAMKFFDLLLEWYELEATTYERFNLVPAEDEETIWESPPWVELGLVEP